MDFITYLSTNKKISNKTRKKRCQPFNISGLSNHHSVHKIFKAGKVSAAKRMLPLLSCTIETPLSVGAGIYVHLVTTWKDILVDRNISIICTRLFTIKSRLSCAVVAQVNSNSDIFNPKSVSREIPVYSACDNINLKIDIVDGRSQLQSTAITVYQEKNNIRSSRTRFINLHNKRGKTQKAHL